MNLDSLSFALSQISYSVANLTKKNYKSSVGEILHLITQHGAEADRHLFRCLFSHVDFSGDGKSSGKDFHQTQYLIQECSTLISKCNFVSILSYAIDHPLHHQKSLKPTPHLFSQLSKVLKLTRVQEVVFGLALLNSSNPETRQYAAQYVRQKLPHLLNSFIDSEAGIIQEGGLQDIAIEVLHLLLSQLLQVKDSFGILPEQKDAFIKALKKDFPKERVPVVLAPLLYPETEDITIDKLNPQSVTMPSSVMDSSLADMILELGYGFTANLEECRNTVMHFDIRELTPASVARVLSMMANSHTGLPEGISLQTLNATGDFWTEGKEKPEAAGPQTWNVDIFVQVVKDLAPHLNWRDVVSELDHPTFVIKNKAALRLLIQGLIRGLQELEPFPIDVMYRLWKNTEGQLSLVTQSLKNPDVFCFADYLCRAVTIEILKTPPDEDNRDIATWKSLNLVELLLRLSDLGHYQPVSELFKYPHQHCPDMLVLALLQIHMWTQLKHELLSSLIPIFLGNHPNSASVLHYAWHCQGQSTTIRTLVMHAMAEWYMRGEHHDQSRLSRILDVAQDLKALSMLLNATPFAFVIDLACLASRREYLKLDKWMSDKIREHGEQFVEAAVHFLKRRCPQLTGNSQKEEQLPQRSQQLPPETLGTMLTCLQAYAGNVGPELSETILKMFSNGSVILSKARPPVLVTTDGKKAIVALTNRDMATSNMGASALPGLPNPTTNAPLPGLPNPPTNSMDPLSGIPPPPVVLGPGVSATGVSVSSGVSSAFASTSLASLASAAPGSPARGFPSLGQTSSQSPSINSLPALPSLSNLPSLPSQLQTLNMPTTLSTSISGAVGRGTPTLGTLSVQAALGKNPAARQTGQPGDVSNIFPAVNQQFSKEIEDEANSYFQRIYNHPPHPTISIEEVLDMLKRFKDSHTKKERDVFACMLRNLFEEYRFFPQYPEKELHTTAMLFGGIIEQGLVTYMDLGIALRYVLEALKKPHGSRMYYFGIAALDKFKTRLKDYPQYCQHLASIQHFSSFPQVLREYIECGGRSQEPPNRPQVPVTTRSLTPLTTSNNAMAVSSGSAAAGAVVSAAPTATHGAVARPTPSAATANLKSERPGEKPSLKQFVTERVLTRDRLRTTEPSLATANIDTLLAGTEGKEEIAVPPEALQDKAFFIFNNLSLANMEQKSSELKDTVMDDHMMWVAQYLVMKRASIEHNFHNLYANFIDHLKKIEFTQMVIKETYRNIKVLLRSDKGVANFSDRSLLKNLGHWLGMLTLAKNKPILHLDIDLKTLLYEAYHKGSQDLLYVVPFVAKVLESCAKCKVFKPPNPWTMAIMNVLAELHREPDLKLNLKFEIEVLCKTLNLDISDLAPGNFLSDTERLSQIEQQLSAPHPKDQSSTPQPEEPLQINMPTPTTTVVNTPVTSTTTSTAPVVAPPQPQFGYHEINVVSLASLAPHITINEQLGLFQAHPQLKQFVRPAIEHAVQELLPLVVERAMKIALTTCEQIVKKDFALDPEEARMRAAAHHMVRFMTSGMALITCRDPLLVSLNTHLKNSFLSALRGATQPQKELIEQATQVLSQDNVELASAFLQKTAIEKAIPEMDKRLSTEYDLRKHARNEGRRYCDPVVLTYQAERMPEQIRLKVGGVTHQQIAVYEEFARNIPGFMPTAQEASQTAPYMVRPMQQTVATDEITQIYDKIVREIDQHLHNILAPPSNPQVAALRGLLESVLLARNSREIVTALALLHKAVEGLLEGLTPMPNSDPELMLRYRDCHLLVLKGLQDHRAYGPQWTNKHVTRYLIEFREEQKYNIDAVDCLIRSHLVNMQQYDVHLSQSMENGLALNAVTFGFQLVQRFCVDEKHGAQLNEADFYNTIEALGRIALHPRQAPEGLPALIETIRTQHDGGLLLERGPGGPTSMMHSGISQARELDDPPGLNEKTEFLLREWVNMYHSPAAGRDSTKAFSAFVGQMHQQGILKTDDLITRFFRLCTEMCVDLCYRALGEQTHSTTLVRAKCFHTLDAFVRLIALLVKHSGDTTNTVTKINLLNKVLGIVAGVLLQDHEVRHTEFQQLPYHRIFIMLFIELNAPEHVLESINYQVLTAFCNTFHILRPSKAPGFAYAWLELVSHRVFIGRMLAITPQQRGWSMYAQLLIDLFKFLAPFLRNAELAKPTHLLYKGTLRVLLVLLHDFPEFLCNYHYTFCDVIPPNCIQMRNLILSAFPRNMRLPDPFTPNLKVDMLPEISHTPRIVANFANQIQPASFKENLDSYLKTRSPVTFLSELRSSLQVSSEPGMRYNIPLINALVLYVGSQAINHIHNQGLTPSMTTIAHSSHMDIFQNLAVDLDTEGRYLFLNAIANQLRFPNSHTHYFSCTLLYLFAEANTESIQEQITRVLLERLIVNRPHPWGLLITFIELIKNNHFKFWDHEFVHCAHEIEKLFDSVARSCMQPKQATQGLRDQDT